MYGDERRKKKGKIPTSDESRYFQTMASMSDEAPESNMKIKYYDVDNLGYKYEKDNDGLISGLERLTNHQTFSSDMGGGIYLGDEGSVPFSENKPPSYGMQDFESSMPFLFGKRDINSPDSIQEDEKPQQQQPQASPRTKGVFDEAGIYLGQSVYLFLFIVDFINCYKLFAVVRISWLCHLTLMEFTSVTFHRVTFQSLLHIVGGQ